MSSTIDANVLLYASDESSPHHNAARDFLHRWAEELGLVYLFWPTVMAYLRISTHPRVFESPLDPDTATANIGSLLQLANVRTGAEGERFWETWNEVSEGVVVRGSLVPDSHIVALMRQHGVTEIWSRDRDFRKFEGVRVREPFSMRSG